VVAAWPHSSELSPARVLRAQARRGAGSGTAAGANAAAAPAAGAGSRSAAAQPALSPERTGALVGSRRGHQWVRVGSCLPDEVSLVSAVALQLGCPGPFTAGS
jgi:hypothetical protein